MIPEISIGEFLLFTIIALIVIRPDDWPKVLRKVGYYYGQIHDFMLQARSFSRKTYHDIIQEPLVLQEDSPLLADEVCDDDTVGDLQVDGAEDKSPVVTDENEEQDETVASNLYPK
ncbi:hypothetical protein BVX99_01675 [bacterium F16]|nr:hypothetical protein BVX99_01675 [bacterium F16]